MAASGYFIGNLMERPELHVRREELEALPGFRFRCSIAEGRWERFELVSSEGLLGEEHSPDGTPFIYESLVRRSGRRVLVVARGKEVSDHLTKMLRSLSDNEHRFKKTRIGVDRLVKHLVDNPVAYVLSAVHAEVPGYGRSLEKCAFWGNDLGEADWFRTSLPRLKAYRCGLRLVQADEQTVSFGEYGSVGFMYRSERSVLEVEAALHYLRIEEFLDEPAGHEDEHESTGSRSRQGEDYPERAVGG